MYIVYQQLLKRSLLRQERGDLFYTLEIYRGSLDLYMHVESLYTELHLIVPAFLYKTEGALI